jgi:hypothetical protein
MKREARRAMSEGKDRSANHTNQDLHAGDADRPTMPDYSNMSQEQQGGPAGQGQHGEEYGVYGRGATEGGAYADHGDRPGEVNPPQRNIAQKDIARKDGNDEADVHADPGHIPPRGRTAEEVGLNADTRNTDVNEVGRGLGDDRFLEGQPAIDSVQQDHDAWVAPRETTWKQNSGAETDFGGKRPEEDRPADRSDK